MRKKITAVAALASASILLTGCGPKVEKDATYETVEDLREAVLEAGLDCPGDTVVEVEDGDGGEIRCTGETTIAVYHDEEDLEAVSLGNIMFTDRHALRGPNWIISGDDEVALGEARDVLGGDLSVNSNS